VNPVLFDSNILIDILNGNAAARDFFAQTSQRFVSSISAFEILTGCVGRRLEQRAVAEMLLDCCEVVPFGRQAAALAAENRAKSKKSAERRYIDFLIEGTALAGGFSIATRNVGDFKYANAFAPY